MMVWNTTSMKRERTERPLRLLFRRQKSTSDLNAKNCAGFGAKEGKGKHMTRREARIGGGIKEIGNKQVPLSTSVAWRGWWAGKTRRPLTECETRDTVPLKNTLMYTRV